jgi:hypothetical protein
MTQDDAEASLEEAADEQRHRQRQVGVPPFGEDEQGHPHLSVFGHKSWVVVGRQNKNFYYESVKVLLQKR